jgi:hypothetical protein
MEYSCKAFDFNNILIIHLHHQKNLIAKIRDLILTSEILK